MLTYEEIMDNCTKYKIENGQVIDKSTNQVIIDEDIIIRVKSSILLYKDAKERYQEDVKQFGSTSLTQEQYVRRTMERFSVNGEQNNFGVNKLINTILSSNGHYEEFMSGKEILNSKFSILIPPQREYSLAFLKMKFREKGLDIEDLQVRQDLSEFQKNGVSKIIIDYKVKEYKKVATKTEENNAQSKYRHPRYAELNTLELQKQQARQNNDRALYDNTQAEIERIIRNSRVEVTPQEWDTMDISQQIAFIKVKLQEAQVLKDEDEQNYWNANLRYLEEKLASSKNTTKQQSVPPNQPRNSYEEKVNQNISQTTIPQHDTYIFYYQQMMNAVKK